MIPLNLRSRRILEKAVSGKVQREFTQTWRDHSSCRVRGVFKLVICMKFPTDLKHNAHCFQLLFDQYIRALSCHHHRNLCHLHYEGLFFQHLSIKPCPAPQLPVVVNQKRKFYKLSHSKTWTVLSAFCPLFFSEISASLFSRTPKTVWKSKGRSFILLGLRDRAGLNREALKF